MQTVYLKKGASHRILNGHPWIFANEITKEDENIKPGGIVKVHTYDNMFVGKGYYNAASQIKVRLLSRNKEELINKTFFENKIKEAWAYRQKLGYIENCRLIFGEADGLPALVIDKFNDYFVLQTLSLGMDLWKPAIVEALQNIFTPKGIYERNDVPVRKLEGLEEIKGFLSDEFDTNIIINENGLQFKVDIANGQKTGYFLDQRDNRRAIQTIVKDADVLEAFTYTGTFSLHAGYYGAKQVLGLDISESAIKQAEANARLNKLESTVKFECVNAFDRLKEFVRAGRQWDVVMLDPPAFTKSRANIQKAITGYKEVNLRGIQLTKPGGFLVTASCTNLVSPDVFLDTIALAAKDAKRTLRQVEFRAQAADHPILWNMENTNYLKFLIVQVL
jgi:23S rRNA (cytosine1962-C5)-methyltransferase